jgi:adenosylmethionine-8-amino-7-oxononanoate aminotransferase
MIGAADLRDPGAPGKSTGYLATAGWRVYEAARRRGVYLRPLGDIVYVTPPLNISDAHLEELLGKTREAIEEAMRA